MNLTDQKIDEIFNTLPQTLQDYILGEDTQETTQNIIAEHDIPNEEEAKNRILLVLMNELSIDGLRSFFEHECGLSNTQAQDAADDVDVKLLGPADLIMQEEMGIGEVQNKNIQSVIPPQLRTPEITAPTKPAPSILLSQIAENKSQPVQQPVQPKPAMPQLTPKPQQFPAPDIAEAVKNLKPIAPLNTPYTSSNQTQPVIKPIPVAPKPAPAPVPPKPIAPQQPIPQPAPQTAPTSIPQFKQQESPASILNNKLSSMSSMPKQEVKVSMPTQPRPQTDSHPTRDPYREPIE